MSAERFQEPEALSCSTPSHAKEFRTLSFLSLAHTSFSCTCESPSAPLRFAQVHPAVSKAGLGCVQGEKVGEEIGVSSQLWR